MLGILFVITIDRWTLHRAMVRIARRDSTQAPLQIAEWALGRVYKRTWSSDPGEFCLEETSEVFRLTEEHLRTHMLVVAPQGGGKTHSVLKPALQLFKRTSTAVICIDAKGNDFDPGEFHLNFDLSDPQNSIRLNVWSGSIPGEMGERLAEALVPEQSEEKRYFSDNAKDTLSSLVMAHHTAYGSMPTLRQVLGYLRDSKKREDLVEELRNQGLPEDCEELDGLWRINQLAEQKNDPLGSLDTALAPLVRGDVAPLITTSKDGYSVEQLLRQPVRVRFALPVGERPRVAPILGRLILAQFTHAVISPNANTNILKAAVVDEAHSFVTPTIAKGMATARQNRGCYILAMQNLSQIENPTLREDILSVAGNKMVMAGVGDFDAKKFSALFGSRERPYTTHSQGMSQGRHSSQSRGSGRGVYGSGDVLNGGLGGLRHQATSGKSFSHQQTQGSSVQVHERAEFLTSEIRGLPRFHAIIERRDSKGEVTPATVVHLDMEVITCAITSQALQLYRETGSLGRASPRLLTATASHQEIKAQSDNSKDSSTIEQVPGWVRVSARQVAQRLPIREAEAEEIAHSAFRNGRDSAYLLDNLEYAAAAPNPENGAELFRFLITSNQHRPATQDAGATEG